jgi:hypothetical protein
MLRNPADYTVTLARETSNDPAELRLGSVAISDNRACERRVETVGYVLRLVRRTRKTLGYGPPQHTIGRSA